MSLSYRPEIDGLRAIAVLSVVILHADFLIGGKNIIPGGFLGVDIFFVISGYLITRIIFTELQDNRFSILQFYERRARRILPPLLLVMLVSFPVTYLFMMPLELEQYSYSIIMSLLFVSNIWFSYTEWGYWAEPAELSPFLHMWSLSVEEQFYVFFPLLLIFIRKMEKREQFAVLFACFVLSLWQAQKTSLIFQQASFFMPYTRAWELLAGALIVYIEPHLKNIKSKRLVVSGLLYSAIVAVIAPMFLYASDILHPSFYTLVPVLGTAVIIALAEERVWLIRVLSSRPFVFVGLVSYSFYLWHLPVLILGSYFVIDPNMQQEASVLERLLWIVVSFILAVVSTLYLERPARNKSVVSGKLLFSGIMLSIMLLGAANVWVIQTNGAEERIKDIAPRRYMIEDRFAEFYTYPGCWACETCRYLVALQAWPEYTADDPYQQCRQEENKKEFQPRIAVVGNSHAASLLIPGLKEEYGRDQILQRTMSSYHWKLDDVFDRDVIADLEAYHPDVILLAGIDKRDINDFEIYMQRFPAALKEKAIVVGTLPYWGKKTPLPRRILLHYQIYDEIPERLRPLDTVFEIEERLREIVAQNNVEYLSVLDVFCQDKKCLTYVGEEPEAIVTWDYAHVTTKGSKYFVNAIKDTINQRLK